MQQSNPPLTTPVVLLVFNRPEMTRRIFQAVARVKPTELLIVADGPRPHHPADVENCEEVRAIVSQVTWDCDVKMNYADHNLGCKERVSSGISWAFSQVETAIILEDDCLPSVAFFFFCQELLDYYKDDDSVMHVGSGVRKYTTAANGYQVSRFPTVWGWATWRSAWQLYDLEMRDWPTQRLKYRFWKNNVVGLQAVVSWYRVFQKTYEDHITSWDYQWVFTCWKNNGVAILSNVPLVKNIGFSGAGTHTSNVPDYYDVQLSDLPQNVLDLSHPATVEWNKDYDKFLQFSIFSTSVFSKLKRVVTR